MGWDYYGYGTYKKKKPKNPQEQIEKLRKKNPNIAPVHIEGNKIAKSWWGMAWNRNLERYADYSNRLSRGKSYVKSDMVLDLQIDCGKVTALVCGTRATPYKITVNVKPLSPEKLEKLMADCGTRFGDMAVLLDGQFSKEIGDVFFRSDGGLFPNPREIAFSCSCPDSASMCKHVAATLYAIGAKLDDDPLLFFTLRDIDITKLLRKTAEEKVETLLKNANNSTPRMLAEGEVWDLFGLE